MYKWQSVIKGFFLPADVVFHWLSSGLLFSDPINGSVFDEKWKYLSMKTSDK
jgi:hypothetical protein